MDWAKVLDLPLALENVRKDLIGDWYRDPWSWPEYDSLSQDNWSIVTRRARSNGVRRVYPIDVPKENFSIRPAMVIDAVDRVLFQALVDRQSKSLIGSLDPWVFGWRLPRKEPTSGRYSPNSTEWKLYRGSLSRLVALNSVGLKTDIVSCFASIAVPRVIEDIEREAGAGEVTARLIDMLQSFDGTPGRKGLPQRSKASSVLANMYLQRIDRVLREHEEPISDRSFDSFFRSDGVTRWMDDMWIFGADHASLRSVQVDIQRTAREAGLELNLGKTAVLDGEELAGAALSVQHSAVEGALSDHTPDSGPLEELIDRITEDPENSDRSSIHFALKRMREHRVDSRREDLVRVAPRMPHGSDHLARVFRDFRWWRDLQEWYLDYERSSWAVLEWSVANLGAMFPSKGGVSTEVRNRFAEILIDRPSLPLFALTAQRLASWDASTARETIRAVLPRADHPHERRILGLASLLVREEKTFIRAILKEYEENTVTLKLIEDRDFRPIKPSPDFSADSGV